MSTNLNRLRKGWATRIAMLAALLACAWSAQAAQRIEQLAEDGVRTKFLSSSPLTAPTQRVCEDGAKWIRLGFKELYLGSYDALALTSSGGDHYVFEGKQWNNRSFHARALRGSCVTITPYFGHPDSRYTVGSYQFSSSALTDTSVVVAGAGDICDSTPADCGATSDLIVAINPTSVFTAGDNAYGSGTLTEYNTLYEPRWGRFKALTNPTPGNHDYLTSGAQGYFDYFNGAGQQVGPAGDRSKGYYSYDVGEWHFIALNTMSGGTIATAQLDWLSADLAATTKPCIAAYFHHPLLSRGNYTGYSQVKPFWDRLYAAKADLVLVGHDHNYQRYAKMNPNQQAASDGIRQVLVGTGGRDFYALNGSHALLEAGNANTHGVLKLTLTATGYAGEFVNAAGGGGFTDSFSGTCNETTPPPTPNFNVTAPATMSVALGKTASGIVSVASSGGYASPVTLSVSGLPSGVSYTFASNPLTPPANGTANTTLTLSATSAATLGTFTVNVIGNDGSAARSASVALTVKRKGK